MKEYNVTEMILIDCEFQQLHRAVDKIKCVFTQNCSSVDLEHMYKLNCKMLKKYIKKVFGIDEKEFISDIYNSILNDPEPEVEGKYACKHMAYDIAFYSLREAFKEENDEFEFSWIS